MTHLPDDQVNTDSARARNRHSTITAAWYGPMDEPTLPGRDCTCIGCAFRRLQEEQT